MTITNAEMLIANKIDFFRLSCKKKTDETGVFDILLDDREFARIYASDDTSEMDALLAWLDIKAKDKEVKMPILTEAERRYLSAAVVRPGNDVYAICKRRSAYSDGLEYIDMLGSLERSNCAFIPDFVAGTMFKGMEEDKFYKPEELGLYEDNDWY